MSYPYDENYGAIKESQKKRKYFCETHLRPKSRDSQGKLYCIKCEEENPSRDKLMREVVADLSKL